MPTSGPQKKKKTGYDKYVEPKKLAVAIAAFVAILLIPLPDSMLDVAVEYTAGETHVLDFFSQKTFRQILRALRAVGIDDDPRTGTEHGAGSVE